jgi:hypothetical protein
MASKRRPFRIWLTERIGVPRLVMLLGRVVQIINADYECWRDLPRNRCLSQAGLDLIRIEAGKLSVGMLVSRRYGVSGESAGGRSLLPKFSVLYLPPLQVLRTVGDYNLAGEPHVDCGRVTYVSHHGCYANNAALIRKAQRLKERNLGRHPWALGGHKLFLHDSDLRLRAVGLPLHLAEG